MGIVQVIYDSAVDLLCRYGAVSAGDGFRQWFYDADYNVSPEAQTAIDKLISKGKSAREIFNILKAEH